MKLACQILFFLWLALGFPSILLGWAWFGIGVPDNALGWMLILFPLLPLYGWWRIKQSEVTPEDIERSR